MRVGGRIAMVAAAVAAAATLVPAAGAAVVVGDQTLQAKTDSNSPGVAEAFRTTASSTGTVTGLTVYADTGSTATSLVAGLYADSGGHPGTLLGQGSLAAPAPGAWNAVAISNAAVTGGATYWIAVLAPAGTLRFRDTCCGGTGTPAETSAQTTLSALPGTWSTGGSYRDGPLSAYGSSVDTPVLVVAPASLSFAGSVGGADPAPQQLSISNGGSGSLSWTASANQPWLSAQPASGSAPTSVSVSASVAGLAAGTYTGTVTVTAPGAQASPATVGVTLTVTAPDTTPPSVSVSAPAAGATISGTTTVTATASDDVGVVGVQLKLDGANLGAELTATPYSRTWDTTTATNGQHTLTAVARDAAGNTTTSASVTVTVQNAAPPPAGTVVGDQALESKVDSNPAGSAEAYRTTALTSGTVSELDVYVDSTSAATTVVAGLYGDGGGRPRTLLASGTIASPAAGAWNKIPIPLTTVTGGTTYWIALLAPSGAGTIRFRDRCCGGGTATATSAQTTLASLPTTWTAGGAYNDGPISAYASGASSLPPADQVGRWSAPFAWQGVAVHAALLPTGKVITWDGFAAGPNSEVLWDPATGTFTPIPYARNLFCAGQAELADGRLLVLGGHNAVNDGLYDTTIYDPFANTYTRGVDMTDNRWYPTVTTLPDGRALVLAGDNITENKNPPYTPLNIANNTLPEVYDPRTNTYQDLTSARLVTTYYPFMFVLPDGRIFDAGPDTQSRILDPATWTWTLSATSPNTGASAVMYLPGKVMKSGTWSDPDFKGMAVDGRTAVIDMTQPSPAWRSTASMAYPRAYEDLTALPDGSVLVTGGTSASEGVDMSTAVLPAELWNPSTETWTTLAAEQNGRGYHSTALLLPDGRVLVAGGGQLPGSIAVNQTNAEIFSPPYLFKGTRPTITSAPSTLQYGASFSVSTPSAASIAKVSLVRLGAVTHAFDQNQRFVPLTFTAGSGSLSVQAPANANLAPPGYYMLFVVDGNGVPSVASFVRLPAPSQDTQPPSAPTGLAATGSIGAVALTWNASTDNVGVTGYNVYRSTTSGFSPSASNRIGRVSGTSYSDTGLAAGTYYYRVTAVDAAGNESAPSAEASAAATADTTAPTVAVTAPAAGATVTGSTTVTATASDDVGVVSVQLLVDGAALGSPLTTAPYSRSWDTTTAANGPHTLTAVATDAAGNSATSAPVGVTVQNAAAPPATFLVGDQALEPTVDYNPAGTAEAFRATAAASGTAARISLYLDASSTATSAQVGLYADAAGHPGALLAVATVAAPAAGAWNTVSVSGTTVTSGTAYWIAVLGRGGTVRFRDRCCGGGSAAETSAQTTLTALPATWTTGSVYRDGPFSIYATT